MTKVEIGKLLEQRRKSLKINQNDLATLSNVSVKTIVQMEAGVGNTTLDVLYRIMEVLGLKIEIVAIKNNG